jgi:hypothetical protein
MFKMSFTSCYSAHCFGRNISDLPRPLAFVTDLILWFRVAGHVDM